MDEIRSAARPPRMSWGVGLFLGYAVLILAAIGLSLPFVVELADVAPVSLVGVAVMVLLAYVIFTITLVLQRKAAARGLALGLTSLIVPTVLLALVSGLLVPAVFLAALGGLLFLGLRSGGTGRYLDQP